MDYETLNNKRGGMVADRALHFIDRVADSFPEALPDGARTILKNALAELSQYKEFYQFTGLFNEAPAYYEPETIVNDISEAAFENYDFPACTMAQAILDNMAAAHISMSASELKEEGKAIILYIDSGNAPTETITQLLLAISATHEAIGGLGFEYFPCIKDGAMGLVAMPYGSYLTSILSSGADRGRDYSDRWTPLRERDTTEPDQTRPGRSI